MSAMELFRSRVAQSAKAAAGAARQLSSLDDMAQNDDYVQSEGLRVSDRKECTSSASSFSGNSEFPSVVDDLSGRFVDAFSTAARKHNRPRPVNESHHLGRQSTPVELASDQKIVSWDHKQQPKSATQQPKLMSSVAALYNQNDNKTSASAKERGSNRSKSSTSKTNQSPKSLATIPSSPGKNTNVLLVDERHAHILHELDYDSETDSSDDEKPRGPQNNKSGSDLEMGRLADVALHDKLEQELEESISRQNSLNGQADRSKQKDVHRFMKMTADLESEREVLLKSLDSVPESTPTNADRVEIANGLWTQDTRRGSAGEETNKALKAGMSWVRNVASPQLEALSKQIMTKVSEVDVSKKSNSERPRRGPMIGRQHPSPTGTRNDVDTEKITMSSSASFLADEDMAELERIRMRNTSSKVTVLMQTCLGNPRLGFITVTFIFALFAYFYSRHKSVDDVLV
mmetsp:Transcript_9409/g.16720  ORF Transcript_9409/g.16720 Transcript_9409/m.16720 type:complete len:459 (-) Transcript_9409:17-1393(-)